MIARCNSDNQIIHSRPGFAKGLGGRKRWNRLPKGCLIGRREAIRLKHCSIHTEDAYVDWGRRFVLFHDQRHPSEMGALEAVRSPLDATQA